MASEIIAGPFFNAVGRGAAYGATPSGPVAAVAGAGTPSTGFGLSALYDGLQSSYFRWSDLLGAYSLDLGLNVIDVGDGELASLSGEWSVSGATVATSGTHAYKGSRSLKVTNTVGGAAGYAYQREKVQAGMTLVLTYAIGWRTAGNARLAVFDTRRARYLTNAGAWSDSLAYVASNAAADFSSAGSLTFTAPSVVEWGGRTGELEVRLYSDPGAGTGDVYGEVLLSPMIDFVGIFGHNIPSNATITLSSYADWWHGGVATVRGTFDAVLSPVAWYAAKTPFTFPFGRLTITMPNGSTARSAPFIGELVLGQRLALLDPIEYGFSLEQRYSQSRRVTSGGVTWATALGGNGSRKLSAPFDLSLPGRQQMRDYVQLMNRGGIDRCVLLTNEIDSEFCALGRIAETGTYGYHAFSLTSFELGFEEDAFPAVLDA